MDLHVSVIADIKHIFVELFQDTVIIDDWCLSGHAWVMNRDPVIPRHINQFTWRTMNQETINQFIEEYRPMIENYDGFIVTHSPVFCRLFEPFNKPILMVNSCRYDQPYCFTENGNDIERLQLNECLQRLNETGLLIPVSNNRADQEYLYLGTGIQSRHIPSLCAYTNTTYNPIYDIPLVYSGVIPDWIPHQKRVHGMTWNELYTFKAIIHIPYEISTMSLFEQYTAGIPIYIPSRELLKELAQHFGSSYWKIPPPELTDTSNVDWWLDRADYYNILEHVYIFTSWEDLAHQLKHQHHDINYTAIHRSFTLHQWNDLFHDFGIRTLLDL